MNDLLFDADALGEHYQAVADALAGPGWGVFPGFASPAQITELTRECCTLWDAGGFRHAGIGNGPTFQLNPKIRTDRVMWLNQELLTPAQQWWSRELEQLRRAINRELFLGLFDFEGHFAVYPPGSYYRRHLDQFKGIGLRTVTTILYLNDNWAAADGGQLRIYLEPDGEGAFVDVLPEAGTLVSFLSGSFLHEVLPAKRERMSLTGWFKTRV